MNAFYFVFTEEYTKEETHKKGLSTLQRRIFSTISTLRMPKEMANILRGLYKNLKRVRITFLVQVGEKNMIKGVQFNISFF